MLFIPLSATRILVLLPVLLPVMLVTGHNNF